MSEQSIYIRHDQSCFFTVTRFAIHVGKIASLRIPTPNIFATSSLIAMLLSLACPLFFCYTGTFPGTIFRLRLTIMWSIPVISDGSQEETLDNCLRSTIYFTLVSSDRSTLICTSFYGWSRCMLWLSFRCSTLDFVVVQTNSGAVRIRW